MNVFDKPDEQSQACLSFAMARKGAMKWNNILLRFAHFLNINSKRVRDAAFFLIIMLVTFAATLLKPQKYVSSRTIQKCVEHVSTST